VGQDNIFIFGLTAAEVAAVRAHGVDPRRRVRDDAELAEVLDMIGRGYFAPGEPDLFAPVIANLLDHGDYYCVTADYRACLEAQDRVNALYLDPDAWSRKSILNTANMGFFSSDRAVMEYARRIWNIEPLGE
jgi:starch phosphorylase